MQPLIDFFSIKDLIPHGYCLSWSPVLLWLHVVSDLLTALAFYCIPLTLIYFVRQRKDFPYPWLAILLSLSVIACGTSHLISAITIWIPLYWLDGLIKAFIALISIPTAVLILKVAPHALSLPSVAQLQAEIEQRKTAEAALRESEYKLNTILDNVEAFIYIKDSSYQYQYANQPVQQLFGTELEGIIGKKLEDFFFDEVTKTAFHENDRLVIELGERIATEEIIIDKDTHIARTYVSIKQPLRDENGNIYGLCSISTDITERKQIESALRESEFLWKFAIEGTGDGVWDWDIPTGKVIYSRRWIEMLGYAENDIQPMNREWISHIHPDDQAHVANLVQIYITGNTDSYSVEFRLRCKNGSYKWILGRGMVVTSSEDNKPLRMIGTHTDISALKHVQEILQEKEWMLSQSQRIAHIGSWSLDLTSGYLSWSDEMYPIYGVTKETFGHSSEAFINLIHPEDNDAMSMWMSDCLNGHEARQLDFRIILPDGTIRFICGSGELQYDDMNKPLRMLGSAQDISERKYREQQDKEHLNQLAHVTRLGLMGEMASGIAHEVNQPLTAISSYTQVSINLLNNENPDLVKLAEILYKTQQQALRAGQIIRRMREFIKSQVTQHAITDVNVLIHDSAGLCIDEIKHNSIKLTFKLQNSLPPVNVDAIQIEQVIINLIRNSIDALKNCPEKQQRNLAINSRLTINNYIEISVTDNGSGINEDQQQQIVMPFYTTKTDGMGMGLSISRSIIEAHYGNLHFTSQPGNGCTFYFTLPVSKNAEEDNNSA
jgi:PAS domain S-box-containing protein